MIVGAGSVWREGGAVGAVLEGCREGWLLVCEGLKWTWVQCWRAAVRGCYDDEGGGCRRLKVKGDESDGGVMLVGDAR